MALELMALIARIVAMAGTAAALQHRSPCLRYPPGVHVVPLPEIQRQFLLSVPVEFAREVPLVLGFHGFSDSPWYFNAFSDFSKHINRYGWLGILPFGLDEHGTNGLGGVNACCPDDCLDDCCTKGLHLRQKNETACRWSNAKDMSFIEEIVKWAGENTCIDQSKVFATGFSNGGVFTNYLACHAGHLIRAFAPISGDNPALDCDVSHPISYVSICGTADDEAMCQYSFEDTAESLSKLHNCAGAGPAGAPVTFQRSATTSCKVWDACPQQNFVEVCRTEGLSHDISGHLRPDSTSYLRPGSDLDFAEYAFQKFSLLANGSMLFWGEPTDEQLRYKESQWPPPPHQDHIYLRNSYQAPSASTLS
ncbi:unnamed protein product [Effrenium voratum]|uniref:Feruloyl esterase n=1 Tax=Effrenium voratum TaxID=2562239 RepID=A0AA36NCU8_9DINO|nr:unnamed protein product [Effrenium voratum]